METLGLTEQYQLEQQDSPSTGVSDSALPLVPPDQVEDVCFYALDDYQTDNTKVTSFNDYVTEQWVDREPDRWNHHSTERPGTTTNHLEGWHKKKQKKLNKSYPNSPKLIPDYSEISEHTGFDRDPIDTVCCMGSLLLSCYMMLNIVQ